MVQGRGNTGLLCEIKEVVGGIGSELVGFRMKGTLVAGEVVLLPLGINYGRGSLFRISKAPKMSKHRKNTEN